MKWFWKHMKVRILIATAAAGGVFLQGCTVGPDGRMQVDPEATSKLTGVGALIGAGGTILDSDNRDKWATATAVLAATALVMHYASQRQKEQAYQTGVQRSKTYASKKSTGSKPARYQTVKVPAEKKSKQGSSTQFMVWDNEKKATVSDKVYEAENKDIRGKEYVSINNKDVEVVL